MQFVYNLFAGEGKYAFLIYFGIATFGVAITLAILLMLAYGLRMHWHLQKRHFKLWKKSVSPPSFKASAEFGSRIKVLNDPVLRKISAAGDKYIKLCLLVWLCVFLLVGGVVCVLHFLGV